MGHDPAVNQLLNGVGGLGRPDLKPEQRPATEQQKQKAQEERLQRIEQRNRELAAGLNASAASGESAPGPWPPRPVSRTPKSEPPRPLPLWLALPPAFTSLGALGGIGNDNNLFPTWAEVLLLAMSVLLLVTVLAVNAWQRWRSGR